MMNGKGHQHKSHQEYMTSQQQDYFRQILEQWRDRLLLELKDVRSNLMSGPPEGGDLIDQSVLDRERMMRCLTRDRHRQTLQQISAALCRLEEGSYGYCLVSGEEIGLQRLKAYPLAILSVEMQEQLEKRQKQSCIPL